MDALAPFKAGTQAFERIPQRLGHAPVTRGIPDGSLNVGRWENQKSNFTGLCWLTLFSASARLSDSAGGVEIPH